MKLSNLQKRLILSDIVTVSLGLGLAWYTGENGNLDAIVLVGICILLVVSNIKNVLNYS